LGDVDEATGRATIKVRINPMVSWVWLGTLFLIIGALVSLNFEGLFMKEEK
jgi:cytochrome c biogenesis factor